MAWATVVGMPPLFDRSAVDPRRSRGRAVAPVRTKPAPQQTASKAIVVPPEPAGKDTAWAGKPDIVKDGKPAPTAEKQLAVLADFSSSEEDDVGKEEDMERRGLAVLVPWQAAKYAAEEFAGKIPRSRVEWKHTPESCRMACICCSCLCCCAGLVVLFVVWSLFDLDECIAETHACDPNADCTNLEGTYDCHCREGYKGDGWLCEDIDECLDPERLGCDQNAECENYVGSFACKCNQGYSGSGIVCDDIDECLEDNGGCGPPLHNLCVNRESDFFCTDVLECREDNGGCGAPHLVLCTERVGAAPICTDIDECAIDNGGCGGGFNCLNFDGLRGLERQCEDKDECVGSVSIGKQDRPLSRRSCGLARIP